MTNKNKKAELKKPKGDDSDKEVVYAEIFYTNDRGNSRRKETVTINANKNKYSNRYVSEERLYEKAKEIAVKYGEVYIDWFYAKDKAPFTTQRIWENRKGEFEIGKLTEEEGFIPWFSNWSLPKHKLNYQAEKYDSLNFTKTTRFSSVALLLLSTAITIFLILIDWAHQLVWIDVFIVLILCFFIYKGSKAAIILTFIYWTIAKLIQIIEMASVMHADGGGIAAVIVWWAIVAKPLWRSYQVEKKRIEIKNEKKKEINRKEKKINIPDKGNKKKTLYCSQCREKVEKDSNYCASCGNKINN